MRSVLTTVGSGLVVVLLQLVAFTCIMMVYFFRMEPVMFTSTTSLNSHAKER